MGINSSKDGNSGIAHPGATSADSVIPSKRRTSRPYDQPTTTIGIDQDPGTPRSLGLINDLGTQIFDQESDGIVPNVFKWDHGGRNVYITGTFNNWEKQIPMHRSGNDFSYVHNLKKGKHAYKFIVDDEWRFAPDQPTVADIEGRINNFIDVSEFTPYSKL
jgi:5'-AMP-activated protein kinase regulatory beta subunit